MGNRATVHSRIRPTCRELMDCGNMWRTPFLLTGFRQIVDGDNLTRLADSHNQLEMNYKGYTHERRARNELKLEQSGKRARLQPRAFVVNRNGPYRYHHHKLYVLETDEETKNLFGLGMNATIFLQCIHP